MLKSGSGPALPLKIAKRIYIIAQKFLLTIRFIANKNRKILITQFTRSFPKRNETNNRVEFLIDTSDFPRI
jgi:hypothetical protein